MPGSTSVCPQHILNEAIRLLTISPPSDEGEDEAISNNIMELEALSKALHRDGIINIKEWNGND